jgi:hypothetical protein
MHLLPRLFARWLFAHHSRPPHDDRGDVPGWVMITVMTAGLVAVIGTIAQDQLADLLRSALNSVR